MDPLFARTLKTGWSQCGRVLYVGDSDEGTELATNAGVLVLCCLVSSRASWPLHPWPAATTASWKQAAYGQTSPASTCTGSQRPHMSETRKSRSLICQQPLFPIRASVHQYAHVCCSLFVCISVWDGMCVVSQEKLAECLTGRQNQERAGALGALIPIWTEAGWFARR
ncbi:hypothetical protein GQ54DRAFT_199446 [Martensiomyces pterosporus]|nr:hypothetical protein GQ54DRAFT_199446 [Martensiomyces pterosporus]